MNFVEMKAELDRNNVFYSPDASEIEIFDKFYGLPITEAQKNILTSLGVVYKEKWCWTRKTASAFIEEAKKYNELVKALPVSPQQKAVLIESGYYDFEFLTSGRASEIIYALPAEKEQLEYIRKFKLSGLEDYDITYGYALGLIRIHKSKILGADIALLGW